MGWICSNTRLRVRSETMVILRSVSPWKSWIQSTDWSDKVTSLRHKRMFRGKQKGKRKGIVGNWTPQPQHTQTLPFKEHMASSLIPSCLWQRQVKKLPRMWLYLKNKLEAFPLHLAISKLWHSQKVVKRKIRRVELSVDLPAFVHS